MAGHLEEDINRLPLILRPRDNQPLRCCVYKDRAVVRSKLLPVLGIAADKDDEFTPLSTYAEEALNREKPVNEHILSVVDEACRSCRQVNYTVTNVCKACDGRFCELNCPKNAISMQNGKAEIDEAACVNCGICEKMCPFHAIVYQPVPCMEVCPVDAIDKDAEGHAIINEEKCILCGKCLESCPFGAIMERSHLVDILKAMQNKKELIALVAPALAGQFQAEWKQILEAVQYAGFAKVVEVAEGADTCAENEAKEWEALMKDGQPIMTTSCCAAYTNLAKKHLPNISEYVSHTKTPLYYTAEKVRKENPEALLVFISPCVAKRGEVEASEFIDFNMSVEELGTFMVAKGIEISQIDANNIKLHASDDGRGFAMTGGVTEAVKKYLSDDTEIKAELINGITKSEVKKLKRLKPEKAGFNFLEVMACEGGCVNGCNTIARCAVATRQIQKIIKNK